MTLLTDSKFEPQPWQMSMLLWCFTSACRWRVINQRRGSEAAAWTNSRSKESHDARWGYSGYSWANFWQLRVGNWGIEEPWGVLSGDQLGDQLGDLRSQLSKNACVLCWGAHPCSRTRCWWGRCINSSDSGKPYINHYLKLFIHIIWLIYGYIVQNWRLLSFLTGCGHQVYWLEGRRWTADW